MDSIKFAEIRKRLQKTQKQLAELLGASVKAVHSYEQGWRKIPVHVERQLFFLLAHKRKEFESCKPCWVLKKCPPDRKKQCPAWEFQAGKFCWFINGTICECKARKKWKDKMEICEKCEVLKALLDFEEQ